MEQKFEIDAGSCAARWMNTAVDAIDGCQAAFFATMDCQTKPVNEDTGEEKPYEDSEWVDRRQSEARKTHIFQGADKEKLKRQRGGKLASRYSLRETSPRRNNLRIASKRGWQLNRTTFAGRRTVFLSTIRTCLRGLQEAAGPRVCSPQRGTERAGCACGLQAMKNLWLILNRCSPPPKALDRMPLWRL